MDLATFKIRLITAYHTKNVDQLEALQDEAHNNPQLGGHIEDNVYDLIRFIDAPIARTLYKITLNNINI